ncbi:hypothetical protein KC332_g5167 [Hortaea werneckii]|uniref:Uncharacterized protein n=2 Tax=Hortaea werneckii TaxID=91943 RepID=A0A3M7HJ64_HORWE|nr:hypothetical protein KC350_g9099 [Hortaea werneckii]OTA31157.1 hypothetical protein BTJ68_08534 [Hortaea werneckii EXF-2000]KAI6837536.1 hypothetical protein KC358_g5088 [Hortaea werneckii]KAI6938445.1 hypothetical protein KC341_g4893 [Hortaea werneckii]KAI6939278.1 hypothetical protein KC348_g5295 [Hortaea werneckii]
MTNIEETKASTAKVGGVGGSQPDAKRRSSPMFASLQGYKRESNPEAFKARKESLSEASVKPESKLGAMWDNVMRGGNQAK